MMTCEHLCCLHDSVLANCSYVLYSTIIHANRKRLYSNKYVLFWGLFFGTGEPSLALRCDGHSIALLYYHALPVRKKADVRYQPCDSLPCNSFQCLVLILIEPSIRLKRRPLSIINNHDFHFLVLVG